MMMMMMMMVVVVVVAVPFMLFTLFLTVIQDANQ